MSRRSSDPPVPGQRLGLEVTAAVPQTRGRSYEIEGPRTRKSLFRRSKSPRAEIENKPSMPRRGSAPPVPGQRLGLETAPQTRVRSLDGIAEIEEPVTRRSWIKDKWSRGASMDEEEEEGKKKGKLMKRMGIGKSAEDGERSAGGLSKADVDVSFT